MNEIHEEWGDREDIYYTLLNNDNNSNLTLCNIKNLVLRMKPPEIT